MNALSGPPLHSHAFDTGNAAGERGTRLVLGITLATMVVEIAAGWWFNSMALLADGWHMSSHAVAIGVSALAYRVARRQAGSGRYAFGTWKIEILGGFASALFLLVVAALMVGGSLERLFDPRPIAYREAIAVAILGLLVNLACAFILGQSHGGHDHGHDHGHGHADLNLRSAYLHVLADAATSVLAILALAGGLVFGWRWLDPAMGFAGAVLVAVWARGLLRDTSRVLLDAENDAPVAGEIREVVAAHPAWGPAVQVADLHVWQVGKGRFACILALSGTDPGLAPEAVHAALAIHEEIVHLTVELREVR
ncbi:CDF family Co(II)/Ni(II) efflux transporter DmeF [Mesoterricola sediminis]|uniref:Metal transporter n=1 Tax=Mesoterricola sediminis TaxID=2927980 RepID=A0AA48KCT3_9BACT|nr:CDF family Co(II)/Ni(II) efflux transporter DmeF [Mesoterricola sediminis]BDU77464.1 metal transporter [Mesoterricola sediminis]